MADRSRERRCGQHVVLETFEASTSCRLAASTNPGTSQIPPWTADHEASLTGLDPSHPNHGHRHPRLQR
jgi:hypothetical protein